MLLSESTPLKNTTHLNNKNKANKITKKITIHFKHHKRNNFRIGGYGIIEIKHKNNTITYIMKEDYCDLLPFKDEKHNIVSLEISGHLNGIKWIDFDKCNIKEIHFPKQMDQLKAISLYGNSLSHIILPERIIANLEHLDLMNNYIPDHEINKLINQTLTHNNGSINYLGINNQKK